MKHPCCEGLSLLDPQDSFPMFLPSWVWVPLLCLPTHPLEWKHLVSFCSEDSSEKTIYIFLKNYWHLSRVWPICWQITGFPTSSASAFITRTLPAQTHTDQELSVQLGGWLVWFTEPQSGWGWKGLLEVIPSNPRANCPGPHPDVFQKSPRRDTPQSLWSTCACSPSHAEWKTFLVVRRKLLCFSLCPCLLLLSLEPLKRPWPHLLCILPLDI